MWFRRAALAFTFATWGGFALAQSQAINGTIEGTIEDAQAGAVPGVRVTVTNVDTGLVRTVTTGSDGFYRALLLPLGSYRVRADLSGFKTIERDGVTLVAGKTAVVDMTMSVGGVEEVVSVTADTPIAEPGKIDLGRTITSEEVKNLPLVSRNPYNFAFLQANVTGYENSEFGVPRINANGSQMHTNYQIDGNTNTQKDRAGLRLIPASEIMVQEVKVITSGFAPEFGQTTGMVYNAITPSGTNQVKGSFAYRYRRAGLTKRPFFLAPSARKPDNNLDDYTASLGGPIVPDKLHYYLGYEYVNQDLRDATRVIAPVTVGAASALGLSPSAIPSDGVIPTKQKVHFALGKADLALSPDNRLTARYYFFKNTSPDNIGGDLNTLERSTDFNDRMSSASLQLVTSFGNHRLNEFRLQYAKRHQFRTLAAGAANGPAINVSGVANFGGPLDGAQSAGFDFNQSILQFVDNLTWIRGRHNFKLGFDLQFVDDDRLNTLRQIYTFPSTEAYLAARSGANPFSYSTFVQDVGDPAVSYSSGFFGYYAQDDIRFGPWFKLLIGLRYDLFVVPDARPFAGNPASSTFGVDRNNVAPRAGFSWTLDSAGKTVLRGSTGIMYEPPLLNFYEDAIQRNGDPRLLSVSLNPTSAGAPAFPGNLGSLPSGFARPVQSTVAIDPNFRTQWSFLTNLELEQALGDDFSVAVGVVNSMGKNVPVLIDTNILTIGPVLGDGRAVYSTAVNAQTRRDPNFNHVDTFRSIGLATYKAATLRVNKRMSHGFQMQMAYTYAKGTDNTPLTGTYVVGSGDDRLSDPQNVNFDKGVTPFNQTHTFALSTVIAPRVGGDSLVERLLDNNQLGIIVQANSGLPFNIRSNRDLNFDGVLSDRPLGIDRNTGRLGQVLNVDARYSRFLPIAGSVRAELFVEGKNILNRRNVASVNRIVAVDPSGVPLGPLVFPGTQAYQQRQLQFGARVTF